MEPPDPALDLAARIADGTGVTWPSGSSQDAGAQNPSVIAELKAIAAIASVYRAPNGDEGETSGSGRWDWNGLTIVGKIDEGRFGNVYRAWDARLERHVALKLLHAPAPVSFEAPTRAIDEARLLARVRHPNVLTVHGAECIDGCIGIWTEFIEGQSLDAWLRERGPLDAREASAIGADVCLALAAVHSAGLFHRDVKTTNVMREVGGRIVLMDFGIAHDPLMVTSSDAAPAGTPLYMAPELFDGGKPTVASDLYAVSVLVFKLLSGEHPITGSTVAEVKAGHVAGRRRRLLDLRPDTPPTMAAAVERGLSVDPAARHASAESFAAALTLPARHSRPDVGGAGGGVFARHRWQFVGGALVLAAAAALGLSRAVLLSPDVVGAYVATPVCRNCADTTGFLSSTGRHAAVLDRDSGDLAIRDLSTLDVQRLFAKKGGWADSDDYAETPVLSRDSRQVAFRWVVRGRGRMELRVMSNRPSAPSVTLLDTANLPTRPNRQGMVGPEVTPHDWRPDGGALLVTLTGSDDVQLAWVTMDGQITVLKSFGTLRFDPVIAARVSPDGRRIVYSARPQNVDGGGRTARTSAGTHLFLLNADGSNHVTLVGTAAANGRPLWAPDGSRVLFTSDVGGSFDLWSLAVADSQPAGSPVLVHKNIGQVQAMGVTPEGGYYYAEFMPALDLTMVSAVDAAGANEAAAFATTTSLVGINPRWSPDGGSMAFFRKQLPAGDSALVVRQMQTQQERVYTYAGIRTGPPMWTADGRAIFLAANRGDGSWWMYRVDLASGTFHEVLAGRTDTIVHSAAVALSPDDRTLYFAARDASDPGAAWNRIVAVDLETGRERVVLELPGDPTTWPRAGHLGITVSPDSRTLAIAIVDPGPRRARVWLAGADGTQLRQLVPPFAVNGAFGKIAWTRDGSIWFAASMIDTADRQGWRIMRVNAAGGTPRAVSPFLNGFDDGASFHPSPDGSRVAWYPSPGFAQSSSDEAGPKSALWMLDLRGRLEGQR